MNPTISTDQFAVFDNCITKEEQQFLWNYFRSVSFEYIQARRWSKVNRLSDGNALCGPPAYSERDRLDPTAQLFPTGSALDIVCDLILGNVKAFEPWIGRYGENWRHFFARPFLYPAGTGLSWHDDYGKSSGAYVLFMHPLWNSQWGGELLIADPSTRNMPRKKEPMYKGDSLFVGPYLDNRDESEKLLQHGVGHYIQPVPGRLVVIGDGVMHMVKKVEPAAGDNCRCSITGFFVNPLKTDQRFGIDK